MENKITDTMEILYLIMIDNNFYLKIVEKRGKLVWKDFGNELLSGHPANDLLIKYWIYK